jgi:hypothetical protein
MTLEVAVLSAPALGATAAAGALALGTGGLVLKQWVGRVRRTRAPGLPWRVDLDEAAAWVTVRLPREVSGLLSQRDVRRILGWNLEYFRSRATAGNGHSGHGPGPVIVAGAETVDYTLAKADAAGAPYSAAQIHAVLAAQVRYLQAIGAAEGGQA